MKSLEDLEIDIGNCRNQSYNNAPNMSGNYQGMQARILKLNPYAVFVPCCAHSLNLVGKTAVSTCFAAADFLGFVEKLFVFFTLSTARLQKLNEKLATLKTTDRVYTLKGLSKPRWSCNYEAVKALYYGHHPIQETLSEISVDKDQKAIVKSEGLGLFQYMDHLETAIYTCI